MFTLSILAALLVMAQPAHSQPNGYWHADGVQLVDSLGTHVRISGVNWYGFETTDEVAHGLYDQDYKTILSTIHNLGYNTVRIPYSNQMVEEPIVPMNISFSNSTGPINTDLKGLTSLQIMDKIIAHAGTLGLKVILDNHRSEAGNSAEASGLWYTSAYPETKWIADWKTLVTRYSGYNDASGNPTVIGVDLRNEPHNNTSGGSCWTGDSSVGGCPTTNTAQNWPGAAVRAGNAVLSVNPNLLIFVEGVDCYSGDCDFWGGNLEGVKNSPVQLSSSQRLVYSAHDYGPTEYKQSWFNSGTTPQSLEGVWTKFWGYVAINGIAPVWVGEFGTTNDSPSVESSAAGSEGQWFSSLISFLAGQPEMNWTYWALNGEDTYGLLDANYDATPPSSLKQQLLSSVQAKTGPGCTALAGTPTGLTVSVSSSSTLALTWTKDTAPANCSLAYSVYRSTASGFTPSAATLITSGLTSASYVNSGLAASTTYYYAIEATDGFGSSAPSAKASATTPAAPVCGAAPATPSGLKASASSSSTIALAWSADATPANCSVSYSVFRGTTSSFTPSATTQLVTGWRSPSFSNSGLNAATTYYYAIEAVDAKGSSAASAKASATTAKAPALSCHVTYSIVSQWSTGFQSALTIENTGDTEVTSWTLKWTFPGNQQISSLWDANYSQAGETVTLTNESYDGTIAPGTNLTGIGLTGTYSGSNPSPTSFSLNGVVCH